MGFDADAVSKRLGVSDLTVSSGLLVVIPLYKQPDLIPGLLASLISVADELAELNGRIQIINDSPGFKPLESAIGEHLPALMAILPVEYRVNEQNVGFVRSANIGLSEAKERRHDVLLLNSDTLLTPGAIAELAAVASIDPMTSVVSPRSNNATICNSPYPDVFRTLDFSAARTAHLFVQPHLPRFNYVPTAVGFCLYIRNLMLEEFGIFDEVYGGGYNEENDFILRCNQRGYRAVLANHAFVFHIGQASFSTSGTSSADREASNAVILNARYPEYSRAIERYFSGPTYRAQAMLAGLVPTDDGRLRILFDCRHISTHYNGTFEHGKSLIRSFVAAFRDRYECHVVGRPDAMAFHGFDAIDDLHVHEDVDPGMPFAVAFRIAQPFDYDSVLAIAGHAPVAGFLMLDTIGMDCQHLDDQHLDRLWSDTLDLVSLIGFNSQFTADQFNRRFTMPSHVESFVSLCSVDERDYSNATDCRPDAGTGHILIVGNHYPHKNVENVLARLREFPDRPDIVILGHAVDTADGITGYAAGELAQSVVDSLYAGASVVLFPSDYEGFGLPIMHALGSSIPVVARDGPLSREIQRKTRNGQNIYLRRTTADMVAKVIKPFEWVETDSPAASEHGWPQAARALAVGIENAIENIRYETLERRMHRLDTHSRLLESVPPGSGTDGRAGHAGISDPAAAPSLADPLGLESAAVFQPTRTLRDRWMPTPWRARSLKIDIDSTCDQNLVKERRVVQLTISDVLSADALIRVILKWSEAMTVGSELRISTRDRRREPISKPLFARSSMATALANAGIRPYRNRRHVGGTKVLDWSRCLSLDISDEVFVAFLYQEILGRKADSGGASHYCGMLAEGASRRELLLAFLTSDERVAFVRRAYVPSEEPL